MESKEKKTTSFGVQECAKCQYKLRCEECVYNEKDITKLLSEERKETAEKYKEFIQELITNGNDSITTYYGDVKYRLIREDDLQELAKQFGIEIKE